MKAKKFRLELCVLTLALSIGVLAQSAASQPAPPPTAATPEAQRLAERLAQQQNRVDGLTEETEQIKAQIQQGLDAGRARPRPRPAGRREQEGEIAFFDPSETVSKPPADAERGLEMKLSQGRAVSYQPFAF